MARKRKYKELRRILLESFRQGQKTVNQVSSETGINWKTVDRHIIYFVGRGYLKEVFSSPYVRIYEMTERGKDALENRGAF